MKILKHDNNKLSIGLMIISFLFLIPGLMAPMITLSGSVKILFINKTIFEYERSILQTIGNLMETNNYVVAFLILFFSVLVPFIKGALLLKVSTMNNPDKRQKLYNFIKNISKWAMADVFVAGIFVAFLAAKATRNMNAVIEPGFYFFTAYCLFSILALQFLTRRVNPNTRRVDPKTRSVGPKEQCVDPVIKPVIQETASEPVAL